LRTRKREVMLKKLREKLQALHKDEGGADMVEYILLVALVGLPLLALIWVFRDKVLAWATQYWDQLVGNVAPPPSGG